MQFQNRSATSPTNTPDLQKFIDRQITGMKTGDFDKVVPHYSDVLPIYFGDDTLLLHGHDELRNAMGMFREKAQSAGAAHTTGILTDAKFTKNGRFQFSADWVYRNDKNRLVGVSTVTYFCDGTGDADKIQMVQYRQAAFPDIGNLAEFKFPQVRVGRSEPMGYLH